MNDLYPNAKTVTEWRVVWFPPDIDHRWRMGSEDTVRRVATLPDVAPWNPVIESRTVVLGCWDGAHRG